MKRLPVLLAVILLSLPVSAAALECPSGTDSSGACILKDSLLTGAPGLIVIIETVTNWIFTILLVLAVFWIIWAGYKYLMTEGNAEEVIKVHRMLIYAAVGIAVAILAKGVVNVVKVIIGGGAGGSSQTTPPTGATPPTSTSTTPVITPPVVPTTGSNIFTPVPGIIIAGKSASVEVETCLDGKVPGVQIGSTKHGDNSALGAYVALGTAVGVPKVQKCLDGYTPQVKINGTLYRSAEANAAQQQAGVAFQAAHTAAQEDDYQLNSSPEVLVPFCGDTTVVSVHFKGVSYDPPAEIRAVSTVSHKYVTANNPSQSEEAFAGDCPDGTFPSPLWLGLQRYYPQ